MKQIVQTLLVLGAVGCALVLSGTATVALAAAVNVPGWAHPAAVGIVEVVAVTGTWLWVTEPRLRAEAATAVVLASAVSGYAGVHAYGAFGLVGPVGAIVTTHLVARAWSSPKRPSPDRDDRDTLCPEVVPPGPDDGPDEGLPEVIDWWADAPLADPARPDVPDRAATLIDQGLGRRRLARELGIPEREARRLIELRRADQDRLAA